MPEPVVVRANWNGWFIPPLLAAMVLAMGIGRYPLPLADLGDFFLASVGLTPMEPQRYQLLHNLIVQIRLPRVLVAVLVGAALSVSGAAYQAVFRNPLVSPGLLGVLAGAGFGAALGVLISGDWRVIQLLSFVMGMVAVVVGLSVAGLFGNTSLVMLVLGGIISGALFASLLSMVKYVADPYDQLPTIVYWLMGSLAQADMNRLTWYVLPMLGGMLVLMRLGRALDALTMGDDEALSLGVPVRQVRYGVIAAATLISALTVSLVGMIGWVGLIVPHITRMLVGPGNVRLLPACAVVGGLFLLAADVLSRTLTSAEIPVGIVTELLGIPIFLLVLRRARKGWL